VFTADIGTPRRMEHVLLGKAVQRAKQAEGAGERGRVNVTEDAYERVKDQFQFEPGKPGHMLVVDNLTTQQLGEFDIAPTGRRLASAILSDTRVGAMIDEIERSITLAEPLASYIPAPILNLLVENAAQRGIPPDFSGPTVMFVNLIGLPEAVDEAQPEEEDGIVSSFSRVFSLINAAVEARGGVLKKVTYHLAGSDIMIFFGVPTAHTNDSARAAEAALAIRDIILSLQPPVAGGKPVTVSCQIGMTRGPVFAAEIGETRGRREFNILSDTVNTSARLMGRALGNRILISEWVYEDIGDLFDCKAMSTMPLKGKKTSVHIYELRGPREVDSAQEVEPEPEPEPEKPAKARGEKSG
jgi:class 3 adenylate cyclase